MTTHRIQAAHDTLRANDRGGDPVRDSRVHPLQSHPLQSHPLQLRWGSAFVAMGFATFDMPRAFDEIDLLLKRQWDNAIVPHIAVRPPADSDLPAPEMWGANQAVLASAARWVWDRSKGNAACEARLAAIYPGLVRYHDGWSTARDPQGTGLVAALHPWETDGAQWPAWDGPLERAPAEAPFRVADIGTNAILHRAELDLLTLSHRFGTAAERGRIVGRIAPMGAAIRRQWDAADGHFYSRDLISDAPIKVATSAGFLPLWAGCASAAQVGVLEGVLNRWVSQVAYAVPSIDPADPRYEPRRYGRGPICPVVNWMIAEGFAGYGYETAARRIRGDTRALVAQNGLWACFDPRDGAGLGGTESAETAAIDLLLTPEA